LLAEATEHEKWTQLIKEVTTLQLERAQDEAKHAESQLAAAEEYMCAIMHAIHSSGFTINFFASQAPVPAVVKVDKGPLHDTSSELYIIPPLHTIYSIYPL
jgi:hypothetical protein